MYMVEYILFMVPRFIWKVDKFYSFWNLVVTSQSFHTKLLLEKFDHFLYIYGHSRIRLIIFKVTTIEYFCFQQENVGGTTYFYTQDEMAVQQQNSVVSLLFSSL